MVKNVLYLASGVAIGYFLAYRNLESYFNDRLAEQTTDLAEFYKAKYSRKAAEDYVKDPEFFESAVKAAKALEEYQGLVIQPEVLAQDLIDTFDEDQEEENTDEEEDGDSELEKEWDKWTEAMKPVPASSDDPSINVEVTLGPPKPEPVPFDMNIPGQPAGKVNYNAISTPVAEQTTAQKEASNPIKTIEGEAFINNISDFKQCSLTYFVGDDVLSNEMDKVITTEAREAILGTETFAFLRSPEARGGEDTVYLQNIQRKMEFEIVCNPGNYVDVVGPIEVAG